MFSLLRRFFDDIHRIANGLAFPRAQDVLVELCQKDRDLLVEAATKFRRNGPRVKKEQRNALEAAKQLNGIYDSTESL